MVMVCELYVGWIPVEQQTSCIPHGETAEYFITTILTHTTLTGRELMRQCHRQTNESTEK